MYNTPDQEVRPQIEAVKGYLVSVGFSDVEDPPEIQKVAFEHQHTIRMSFENRTRILRLDYGWLSDHTVQQVRTWLDERAIGDSLQTDDTTECSVSQGGLITWK